MFITLKKIQKMREDGVNCIKIDGNTVITKKAYNFAVANEIDLIAVNASVINEKRMDVMKDPGIKIAKIAYIIHLVFLDNKRHIVLYLMKCAYPFEEEN